MKQEKIAQYVQKMSKKEKVAQLFQIALCYYQECSTRDFTGPLKDFEITQEAIDTAGSIIGFGEAKEIEEIEKGCHEKSGLSIPTMIMADVIHGYQTIFPIPIGLSCSWNVELVEETCRIAAKEASVCGIHATFAPMADLVRDPRWGRVMEATGEDPYLNALFSAASVKGFQGKSESEPYRIASCVKHFAGYGAPEAGREYNTVDISEGMLREYYLNPYQTAVLQGCCMVMTAFNTIDRVPATCNQHLLQDILRKEWNYDGVIISDWNAIEELCAHSVAENGKEAARKALVAGVDIDMMSGNYLRYLEEITENDIEMENLLNASVERVLQLKNKLGLFENPIKDVSKQEAEKILLCKEHRVKALEAAKESIVLLKNDAILPLDKKDTIVLAGEFAKTNELLGSWSAQGKNEDCISVEKGFENLGIKTEDYQVGRKETKKIVMFVGESQMETGESTSKTNLHLKEVDRQTILQMYEQGIEVVLVIFSGRPFILTEESKWCKAIVQAWFPGTEGGNAIAQMLIGDYNPVGRLTMTFPRSMGQIPIYYNHFRTGRPQGSEENKDKYVSKYIDSSNTPLFPFGHGLSYTEFSYGGIKLSKDTFCAGESIEASIIVTNVGKRSGYETIQLYICDCTASVVRPVMELKAFRRIELKDGDMQEVIFTVEEEMLKFGDETRNYKAEEGKFSIMIGKNAMDYQKEEFNFTL